MPDIRDVLKGLSPEFAAIYTEVRTTMRRAYLYAHSKTLPIEQYEEQDDQFLDLIDIKVAQLFDRSGSFDHSKGNLDTDKAKVLEGTIQSAGSKMLTNGWPAK